MNNKIILTSIEKDNLKDFLNSNPIKDKINNIDLDDVDYSFIIDYAYNKLNDKQSTALTWLLYNHIFLDKGIDIFKNIKEEINGITYTHIIPAQFFANTPLQKIMIPEGITLIDFQSFRHCKILKKVTCPKSLRRIDGWAFDDCPNLQSISIENTIKEIERSAFGNGDTNKDLTIYFSGTIKQWKKIFPQGLIQTRFRLACKDGDFSYSFQFDYTQNI